MLSKRNSVGFILLAMIVASPLSLRGADLVVQGRACIGPVCTAAGSPTLTLKEDFGGGPLLTFDNTGCCHPSTRDWAIQTNDVLNANGDFYIRDVTQGTIPFKIQGFTGNVTILGTLTQGSDRFTKRDIVPVDPKKILEQLAALPIATWTRKTDPASIRHLGPMAQDFKAIFGLGDDERSIATLDMAGVSMAAIQALHTLMNERDTEIAALRRENADLGERLKALEMLIASAVKAPATVEPAP
jgi:Chaperone of endosialidase